MCKSFYNGKPKQIKEWPFWAVDRFITVIAQDEKAWKRLPWEILQFANYVKLPWAVNLMLDVCMHNITDESVTSILSVAHQFNAAPLKYGIFLKKANTL